MKSFDDFAASVDWVSFASDIRDKANASIEGEWNYQSYIEVYSVYAAIESLKLYHEWLNG